ncbi:KpsF/GutQ family sugar-phosphate isomerase [Candidatus Endowatersipora endosymbiont of Watersipora subatra]|uniref:KpsF/GutQ family sugar-phosphate isomerase n=1 Tax=Candidatus Endowatersipora endosymbiont of Watersipora subatra TaxID=3077946 RepID=UPI00312C8D95
MLKNSFIQSALKTLKVEQAGLNALIKAFSNGLEEDFFRAVKTIFNIKGHLVVTGVGKSGHIAAKIASTLASTGTSAFFIHATEANHGDLGMIGRDDAILAISWSGETKELQGLFSFSKRFSIPLIALTANRDSTLAMHADIILALPREKEACPHNLAPTTSSLMQLAIGDALAISILESRSFTPRDFRLLHPGGQIGTKLILVNEIMHKGKAIPLVKKGTQMTEAILQISGKGFGCVGIINDDTLIGIITDEDLRRHINPSLLTETVDDIMTESPQTISPDMLAIEAFSILNQHAITTLMVTEQSKPVGIIHSHDLLRLGIC